eukprot:m.339113 g.339113  ORF g.339113 m.339113 type:complete len:464 (-) comp20576_c0_seq3:126-1517(-)
MMQTRSRTVKQDPESTTIPFGSNAVADNQSNMLLSRKRKKIFHAVLYCAAAFMVIGSMPYLWINGATMRSAENYYEETLPLIAQSRQEFVMHDYFKLPDPTNNGSISAEWIDMIKLRMKSWAHLQHNGIDHHKVEKDKCECQKFLTAAGVRTVPILGEWRESTWDRKAFRAVLEGETYPIIIKMGHIQQSRALRIFRSKEKTLAEFDDVVSWVESWFPERFDDASRSWKNDVNVLYNALSPCVLVHPVLTGDWIAPTGAPIELKVEVVWGRAYLAFIETRECAVKFMGVWLQPQSSFVLLRNGKLVRFVEWPKRFRWEWIFPWDQVFQYLANVPYDSPEDPLLAPYRFVADEPYLSRVFATAETVARRLGADQVRVDIFVSRDPDEWPIVNEISLSSGHYYRYHNDFLAQQWGYGHSQQAAVNKHYSGDFPVPRELLGPMFTEAEAVAVKQWQARKRQHAVEL